VAGEVFKHRCGIIRNKGQKPIIVNGVSNHVDGFIGLKPAMALSDLVRDIKTIPPISFLSGWIINQGRNHENAEYFFLSRPLCLPTCVPGPGSFRNWDKDLSLLTDRFRGEGSSIRAGS
jgi:hypothetical protein